MKALTKSEKIALGTKEIAKRIRRQLKREFPRCKFSVVTQYFSMGSSITVSLMKADRRVKANFDEITEKALFIYERNNYSKERIKDMQNENYHQLNQNQLREPYDPDTWCNGVFLTKEGHALLYRLVNIVDYYQFDESDIRTDYHNTNFYFHPQLGKWNKPFNDGPSTERKHAR